MNRKKIISDLKNIVTPYVQDKKVLEDISEENDFIKDLKINSANLIDIILDVEKKYNIEIDNESIEKMKTVGEAIDIITSKLSKK
jgi:acyl carrier protein